MDFITIKTLFSTDYFAIPDYQRDYEWTNAQNSTLLEDIFSVVNNSSCSHFLGAIVTIPYEKNNAVNKSIDLNEYKINEKKVKHIVDGQQRLTSFSVLLKAVYDVLEEDTQVRTEFKNNLRDVLERLFIGAAYNSNFSKAPILILNGNTGRCYNNEILKARQERCNKSLRGAKRLLKAYNFFKSEIEQKRDEFISERTSLNTEDYFTNLVNTLTEKITFVVIECDGSLDAFQVFDSLNGKGLDLTAADRIKNIMMSWSPPGKGTQKWDALVQQVGEEYLAGFFVSLFFFNSGKRISKNKLPDEFRNKYKNSALTDFEFFYDDLKTDGAIYGQLRAGKTNVNGLDEVLKDFKDLKLDQVYVLLFAVAKYFGEDVFKKKEYLMLAKMLLALIVRMQIGEKSMNKLDVIFSDCIDMMKNQSASLTVICSKLEEKKLNLMPNDQFERDFSEFAPKDTSIAEIYLRHLENQRRTERGNRTPVERGLTVEHIIPQGLDDLTEWYGSTPIPDDVKEDFHDCIVESIGNKMLLYGDDNTSASNNDYIHKVDVYKEGKRSQNQGTPEGTFQLVKDLLKNYPDAFNHDEVKQRAKELAKLAAKIW